MKIANYKEFLQSRLINENVQQAKTYLLKKAKAEKGTLTTEEEKEILNDPKYLEIKKLLAGNDGWVNVFTRFVYEDKVSIEELKVLLERIKKFKNSISKLPRRIDQYFGLEQAGTNSYQLLVTDLDKLESSNIAKRFIDELPGEFLVKNPNKADYKQKVASIRKSYDSASPAEKEEVERVALAFEKLGNTPEQTKGMQKIFFKIVKRYRTLSEVVGKAADYVESCKDKDIKSLFNRITEVNNRIGESKGAQVLYMENDIIVFHVLSFEANKSINSSCTHCIVDDQALWNTYIEEQDSIQIYIWDFNLSLDNKKSIMGITVKNSGEIQEVKWKDNTWEGPFENEYKLGEEGTEYLLKIFEDKKIPLQEIISDFEFNINIFEESFFNKLSMMLYTNNIYFISQNIHWLLQMKSPSEFAKIFNEITDMNIKSDENKEKQLEVIEALSKSPLLQKLRPEDHPIINFIDDNKIDMIAIFIKNQNLIPKETWYFIWYANSNKEILETFYDNCTEKPDFIKSIVAASYELLTLIFDNGANPPISSNLDEAITLMLDSITLDDDIVPKLETLNLLKVFGYDIGIRGESVLDEAIADGWLSELESYIKEFKSSKKKTKKVKPASKGELNQSDLDKKSIRDDISYDELKKLLDQGANPNYNSAHALTNAITEDDEDKAELLLQKGAKVTSDHLSYANKRRMRDLLDKWS